MTNAPMKAPSVGIVWAVPDDRGQLTLVLDRTSVAEAEPSGACLNHPRGHSEVLVRQPERIHPRLHSGAVKDTSPARGTVMVPDPRVATELCESC